MLLANCARRSERCQCGGEPAGCSVDCWIGDVLWAKLGQGRAFAGRWFIDPALRWHRRNLHIANACLIVDGN